MWSTGYIVGVVHLLTLSLGLGSVTARAVALKNCHRVDDLNSVFLADNLYGIAAMLWLGTGLWRAFGGIGKGTEFYLSSTAFWLKISLFCVVLMLELYPMITLIRWRLRLAKARVPSLERTRLLYKLTVAEIPLLVLIVFAAAAMADGY